MIVKPRHRAARHGLIAAAAVLGTLAFATSALADAPTGSGAFVIGDQNAVPGNQVTFWGAQWWKDNRLSGGRAPASFKGFADTASVSCPLTPWSTAPGNSSNPPATLDAFAAGQPGQINVIVTDHVDKSGPVISGDAVNVATVAVDPGSYGPNPGHPGTGRVISVMPCVASGGGIVT